MPLPGDKACSAAPAGSSLSHARELHLPARSAVRRPRPLNSSDPVRPAAFPRADLRLSQPSAPPPPSASNGLEGGRMAGGRSPGSSHCRTTSPPAAGHALPRPPVPLLQSRPRRRAGVPVPRKCGRPGTGAALGTWPPRAPADAVVAHRRRTPDPQGRGARGARRRDAETLGVPTSRAFSLIETGEALERGDEPSPTRSAVLTPPVAQPHPHRTRSQRQSYLGKDGEPDASGRSRRRGLPPADPRVRGRRAGPSPCWTRRSRPNRAG